MLCKAVMCFPADRKGDWYAILKQLGKQIAEMDAKIQSINFILQQLAIIRNIWAYTIMPGKTTESSYELNEFYGR